MALLGRCLPCRRSVVLLAAWSAVGCLLPPADAATFGAGAQQGPLTAPACLPNCLQAQASLRNTLLGSITLNGGSDSDGSSSNSSTVGGSMTGGQQQKARGKGAAVRRPQRRTYPPLAKPDPKVVKERCGAAKGDWCGRYDAQKPFPAEPPPTPNVTCLWGCTFVGAQDEGGQGGVAASSCLALCLAWTRVVLMLGCAWGVPGGCALAYS